MLQLTAEEQTWLDAYRAALNEKHPGAVQEMLLYDSKARGQARADSDLDVLLIIKNDANALKRELRWIGYLLAARRTSCHLFSRLPKQNGKAEGEAGRLSVKRSSATRSASYESQYGGGGVESRS